MTLAELITDLKAAGANENTIKLALNCYELGKAETIRQHYGYAGVTLWLGDARVTQIVTEAQIKHEREPGTAITWAANKCLAMYADARGPKGEA